MAKNIKSLSLLRNGIVYATKEEARQGLVAATTNDGVAKLARYLDPVMGGEPVIRTLVGFYANAAEMEDAQGGQSSYTILDIDGGAADVQALRDAIDAINAKIGSGFDSTNTIAKKFEDVEAYFAAALTALEEALRSDLDIELTTAAEPTSGYLKTYILSQGGVEVGKIDIPKDLVITEGSLVYGTWSGTTFIEDPQGRDTAIKLVIANQEAPIYINTKDLIDVYDAGNGIEIVDNRVAVKLDPSGEAFLTVSENGLKLDGVQVAIDAAKLYAGDGIKILGNQIKAYAPLMNDGVQNAVIVDAEGIRLDSILNMGFYDSKNAAAKTATDIASITEPQITNLVVESTEALEAMTANTEYKSIAISNAEFNNADIKLKASEEIVIDNLVVNGTKGASNGRVLFTADTVNINGFEVSSGTTAYNVVEGNQSTALSQYFTTEFKASNVTVDNTMLNHNVFNIYTFADDATVEIKDAYFNLDVDKSNALRLANYSNATRSYRYV